jgi:PKD repeat protein
VDIAFQDMSIGAATLAWDFGDGTTQTAPPGNITHTFLNTDTATAFYDVQLIATSANGCHGHDHQHAPGLPAGRRRVQHGYGRFVLRWRSPSPNRARVRRSISGTWVMAHYLTGPAPSHTYVNTTTSDQTYTVTLIATSTFGCSDTIQHSVIVHPVPIAQFLATPFTQQFPNATVDLVNNSVNGTGWLWDFGDGGTSAAEDPLAHTYATWGVYTITLVVNNALCTDTVTQDVEITPPIPTADFFGGGEGCVPLTIAFTNTSLGGLTYEWNFGDGGTKHRGGSRVHLQRSGHVFGDPHGLRPWRLGEHGDAHERRDRASACARPSSSCTGRGGRTEPAGVSPIT